MENIERFQRTAESTEASGFISTGFVDVTSLGSLTYTGNMWIGRSYGPSLNVTYYDPLMYSHDGIKWKKLVSARRFPDALDYYNAYLVGGAILYTWNKYFLYINSNQYSYDLYNWSVRTPLFQSVIYMFYDGKIYLRAGGAYGALVPVMNYSYEGLNWKNTNAGSFIVDTHTICGNNDVYVAGGNDNNAGPAYSLIYSYNGITWFGVANSLNLIKNSSTIKIIWNGSIFLCAGIKGTNIDATPLAKSYDGINWVSAASPTLNSISAISWNNNVWSISTSPLYYSYDLITWTTSLYYNSGIKQTIPTQYKGLNLFSTSNSLYRYYGTSTSTFTNIKEIQICYGQTTVGADNFVTITNLPYTATTTYFAIAQVSDQPTTYAYGQAQIISASSIRVYNQNSAQAHTVMWKTIGY